MESGENSVKIIEDSEMSERRKTEYNSESWAAVLKDIWKEDGVTLHLLSYEKEVDALGHHASSSSRTIQEHSSKLTTFFTTNGLIGVAPKGIEGGDVIWKVDWTNTIAVIRLQNGQYTVVGKALIADGVLKTVAVNEITRSFYNSVQEACRLIDNYIMPHNLGELSTRHQTGNLIWPQPKFGVFKYETAPGEEISIEISSPILQALTSPLGWQEKGLKGHSPLVAHNPKIIQKSLDLLIMRSDSRHCGCCTGWAVSKSFLNLKQT